MVDQSAADKMFDQMFEFKMMSKQFNKEAQKAKKQGEALELKIKDAIKKNKMENAKVLAGDLIRKQNESKRYETLSSKVGIVYQRLSEAYKTQQLTENMMSLTNKMMSASSSMDLVKINETMENFEKLFDNIDVSSQIMNGAFENVTAGVTNEKEVNTLMDQVAERFGLEIKDEIDISANKTKVTGNSQTIRVKGQKEQEQNLKI